MPLPPGEGPTTPTPQPGPKRHRSSGGGSPAPSSSGTTSTGTTYAPLPQPSASSAPVRPLPSFSNIIQELADLVAGPTQTDDSGFNLNIVNDSQAQLDVAQQAAATPDYSAYLKPPTPDPNSMQGALARVNADMTVDPVTPPKPTRQENLTEARQTLVDAQRLQREHAIGADVAGPTASGRNPSVGRVKPMTQAEYDALTPKERAAVDFNTMLVQAVRQDTRRQNKYDPSQAQQNNYDLTVTKMFGDDRGSETYAPETLAVLHQIGFSDDTADLDDFLGLNAAITARDLKFLKNDPGPTVAEAQMNPVRLDRYELTETLATSTKQMEDTLARGNQMLASIGQTTAMDRIEDLQRIGGLQSRQPLAIGYGGSELDAYFQRGFDILASKENTGDRDEVLATMSSELSPSEFDSFMEYADSRSKNAERYDLKLGQGKGYKPPEQFRKMMGLEKGATDAG